ncbi:MAG: Gfo/Idh/MocA family oxidoreductase [Thermomicrobia bacterium]|nr:Gfo/Idh/MocA family oxidoreductase [Thermomicrobia bacterium]MCA1725235.1 Gfo/Idh/MocA family oxidoreductase [Thermomicrobia bacterium]
MGASRIQVGVIGTGIGAQVHLPAFAALPDFEIVAICGRNGAKVEAIADAYDIRNTFTNYRDLIACGDVQAVAIAVPPAQHHPAAIAAITAGKHVLCEKPMARNANEAREMVRMAEMSNVTAMLSHAFRFVPARARMKELLDEGYIGAVSLVQLSFLRPLLAGARGNAWRWLVDADAGGGMLGALGSHFVDALRWWFGEISEVAGASSVSAQTVRTRGGALLRADAEDTFAMLLRFASGAIGNIVCSAAASHGPGEEIRAIGADGTLTIALDGTLWGARSGDRAPEPLPIPARLLGSGIPEVDAAPAGHALIPPFIRLARAWAYGIGTGTSPSPSFADGLRVQEALDAVPRSQEQHKWVDVSGARWPTAPSR